MASPRSSLDQGSIQGAKQLRGGKTVYAPREVTGGIRAFGRKLVLQATAL